MLERGAGHYEYSQSRLSSSNYFWDCCFFCAKIATRFCCFLTNKPAINSFHCRNGQQPRRILQEALMKAMTSARKIFVLLALLGSLAIFAASLNREVMGSASPEIPKTWDEAALAD